MAKKITLVIAFIFFTCISAKSNTFPDYYKQIVKAEKLFIADSLDQALAQYLVTFSTYSSHFIYDYLIPIQLSIYKNDTISYQKIVTTLELDQENTTELIKFLREKVPKWNVNWEKTLSVSVQKKMNKSNYQHLIDSLFLCDQNERNHVYSTSFFLRKKEMKIWDENSKIRMLKFMDFVTENGFPNDYQMGINPPYFYHKKMMVIFYHYPTTFSEFTLFFNEWLKSGKLHPKHYAWIADFHYRHGIKRLFDRKEVYHYGVFASQKTLNKLNSKLLIQLNENRATIGLPSVEHELKLNKKLRKMGFFRYTFM